MTNILQKLLRLTHERLNKAIANAVKNNPDLKNLILPIKIVNGHSMHFFFNDYSPYRRLAELLYENENSVLFGTAVLAELFDVKVEDMGDHSNLFSAIRIFLKFKLLGIDYQSENGNGNSCLHDALFIKHFSDDLARLLLRSGADPDLENDDRHTSLALIIQQYYGHNEGVISALCSYELPSHERIICAISAILRNMEEDPMLVLVAATKQFFFVKHPDILNFNCHHSKRSNLLLHTAVDVHTSKIVYYLLCNGADPDLRNAFQYRPIDIAAGKAMAIKDTTSDEFEDVIKTIAYLLISSIHHSLSSDEQISASDIVDELFNLALITQGYRRTICNVLFNPELKFNFHFSLNELLSLLCKKSKAVCHEEFQFSSLIGEGAYGKVYKCIQFGTSASTAIAVKQNVRYPDEHVLRLEANIHRHLNHPNIIQFIGTLERYSCFGMMLEFAGGGSLRRFIKMKNTDDISRCMYSFAKQMNAGLKYIHSQGYVHLDFKPENVLLDDAVKLDAARIMIADFGSAAKQGKTKPENVTTVLYCSPERFDWEIPYEFANDTFSFGVTLGVMETKKDPWIEIISDTLIPVKIWQDKRTTFGNAKMRPHIAELIKVCCYQDPKQRPDCDEIDAHLESKFKPF